MEGNSKILILCPHLNNIGGTELETLITAKFFLKNNVAQKIVIFSPQKPSDLIKDIDKENQLFFKYYPNYVFNKYLLKLDSFIKNNIKSIPRNFNLIEYFYWFFKMRFSNYNFIYVVGSTNHVYFYPIIANYNLKKVIIKHTAIGVYNNWNKYFESIICNCRVVFVTCEKQKIFIEEKYRLKNVEVVDVFIENEHQLNQIEVVKNNLFIFGMLGRISREKRLEDGIKLIKKLVDLNYKVKLIIRGVCNDSQYLEFLNKLLIDLNISDYVQLKNIQLDHSRIQEFYSEINVFLITSIDEGGPNTGLECLAAGIPILSYDVGAMKERLEPFKKLFIADDLDSLLVNAEYLINFTEDEYNKLSVSIKKHYMEVYNNDIKFEKINSFFAN